MNELKNTFPEAVRWQHYRKIVYWNSLWVSILAGFINDEVGWQSATKAVLTSGFITSVRQCGLSLKHSFTFSCRNGPFASFSWKQIKLSNVVEIVGELKTERTENFRRRKMVNLFRTQRHSYLKQLYMVINQQIFWWIGTVIPCWHYSLNET